VNVPLSSAVAGFDTTADAALTAMRKRAGEFGWLGGVFFRGKTGY
jgi:hypothetical protein